MRSLRSGRHTDGRPPRPAPAATASRLGVAFGFSIRAFRRLDFHTVSHLAEAKYTTLSYMSCSGEGFSPSQLGEMFEYLDKQVDQLGEMLGFDQKQLDHLSTNATIKRADGLTSPEWKPAFEND